VTAYWQPSSPPQYEYPPPLETVVMSFTQPFSYKTRYCLSSETSTRSGSACVVNGLGHWKIESAARTCGPIRPSRSMP